MPAHEPSEPVRYEFEDSPAAGNTMPVAPGVHWLRMPLPFALTHINLWLLEDDDQWTIVDTGVHVEDCRDTWRQTFAGCMQDRPPGRVVVTHLHPDHVGNAGWLCDRFDAPLWMTRDEYLLARVLVADTGRATPEEGDRFYTAAGFESDQLDFYHKIFGVFGQFVSELPEAFHRMRDGDRIAIGPREWEVIVGKGHSPEHACLYCAADKILISGDQLLPTISSNVSVFPTEPDANPLQDWMQSLANMKTRIPSDTLVLPAHGRPFRGAHGRLDALIAEHHDGLEKLETLCEMPRRAVDVFPALFKSQIRNSNLIMATGESIAHLNYLLGEERLTVERDGDGVDWYRRRT